MMSGPKSFHNDVTEEWSYKENEQYKLLLLEMDPEATQSWGVLYLVFRRTA